MKALSIESTARNAFSETVPRSRFSMVKRRAFDVDDGGVDVGDLGDDNDSRGEGNCSRDPSSPAVQVAGPSSTGLSRGQKTKMRSKIGKRTKKVSTDSPRTIPVVRPIYTYAR